MPACMAHYQFGQDVLNRLDADIRAFALAHKSEYDIGLQGPDIFYYYKPYRNNKIFNYGIERHSQPGVRMFAPILEKVHEKAALSYMLGLLCHYTLDKNCHPYVYGYSIDLPEHFKMEAAYDRHILSRRGLTGARHLYIPVSGLDFDAMASLWPGMTVKDIKKCVMADRRYTWLLDHKKLMLCGEMLAKKRGAFSPMTLADSVTGIQNVHAQYLDALYEDALEECPELIRRAVGRMGTNQASDSDFKLNYEGTADEQG